jgi:hypothetical protein
MSALNAEKSISLDLRKQTSLINNDTIGEKIARTRSTKQ